jgi:hypothetical protein
MASRTPHRKCSCTVFMCHNTKLNVAMFVICSYEFVTKKLNELAVSAGHSDGVGS